MSTPTRLPLVTRETLNGIPVKLTFDQSFLDYFPEKIIRDEITRQLDHPLEDVLLHANDPNEQTFGLTTPYLVSLPDFDCAELRCTRRVDLATGKIDFTIWLEWVAPKPIDLEGRFANAMGWAYETYGDKGIERDFYLEYLQQSEDGLRWLREIDRFKAEFDHGFTTKGLTHPHLLPVLHAAHTSRQRFTVVDRSLAADGVGSSLADLAKRRLSPRLLTDLAAFSQQHQDQGGGDVVYLCFRRKQPTWPRAMITILH